MVGAAGQVMSVHLKETLVCGGGGEGEGGEELVEDDITTDIHTHTCIHFAKLLNSVPFFCMSNSCTYT